MKELLDSYSDTLLIVKERLKEKPSTDNSDYRLLNSAKSDLEYVVEWLSTGRRPGNRRGVERLAYYQRENLMDPQDYQFLKHTAAANKINCRRLSEEELRLLDSFMAVLSPREKDVYTMIKGYGYSYEYTAEIIGISKSRVQNCINRAKAKLDIAVNDRLQMAMFG